MYISINAENTFPEGMKLFVHLSYDLNKVYLILINLRFY